MNFSTIEEVIEVAEGNWGDQQDQAEAQQIVSELGAYTWKQQQPEQPADGGYMDDFTEEILKLEEHIDRKLNAAEIQRLYQQAPEDRVPEFVREVGAQFKDYPDSREGRQERLADSGLGTEEGRLKAARQAADNAIAAAEAAEPQPATLGADLSGDAAIGGEPVGAEV